MNLFDDSRATLLNRDEIRYLMDLFKVQSLIGIDAQQMSGAFLQAGRQSLIMRGMVQEPEQGQTNDRVRGDLLRQALAALLPQRVLVVVREAPSTGAQLLVFLRREETTVLHTLPRQGIHRWLELESAEDGIQLLNQWFPLENLPVPESNVIVPVETFEKFRAAAAQGTGETALQVLFYLPIPQEEKTHLLQAMQQPAVSGSFALLTCAGETIITAESLAILAGSQAVWAITRPAEDSEGNTYRIRGTGPDLPIIFTRMFAWLMG